MSSDALPTIGTVRVDLAAHVRPMLPDEWLVVDHLAGVANRDVPQLIFEFTGISNRDDGGTLANGDTLCSFDLVIVVPTGDAGPKAEASVDVALEQLLTALDDSPVYWGPDATKQRLDGGQYAWRVPLRIHTRTIPADPDPDPAP